MSQLNVILKCVLFFLFPFTHELSFTSTPQLGSLGSKLSPMFLGGPQFACLVNIRIQLSFHISPNELDYGRKTFLGSFKLGFGGNVFHELIIFTIYELSFSFVSKKPL